MIVRRINPWTNKARRRGWKAYRIESAFFYWTGGRAVCWGLRLMVEPNFLLDRWLEKRVDETS